MTSMRRIQANRANARKSTGPKSKAGKANSSRNALRHGLEAVNIHDSLTHKKIKSLASLICGEDAELTEEELATTIAECQITLGRVRAARVSAIEQMRTTVAPPLASEIEFSEMSAAMYRGEPVKAALMLRRLCTRLEALVEKAVEEHKAKQRFRTEGLTPLVGPQHEGNGLPRSDVESFRLAIPQLLAIERYERRTLSRRRRAMEAFRYIRSARLIREK